MSSVVISGDTSGSVTLSAPAVSGSTTINLPTVSGGSFIVSDSSGNVGIGTSSPATKLEVNGPIRVGSTDPIYFGGTTNYITGSNGSNYLQFVTNGTEQARITSAGLLQFNSGYGSVATAYGCRAWVNFNGTGTVAIRASGNVSSITDNGTGTYTVNITNAMPDANFAMVVQGGGTAGGRALRIDNPTNMTTTTAGPILCRDTSDVAQDWAYVAVAIFR